MEMKWLPIETAPKDGTYLFLIIEGYIAAVGYWSSCHNSWMITEEEECCEECWETALQGEYKPTHWMPIPPIQTK